MRHILLASLVLSVSGCGSQDDVDDWVETTHDQPESVNYETPVASLKHILDSFLFDCGTTYGADVSASSKLEYIRYGDPSTQEQSNIVGLCSTWRYKSDSTLYKSNIVVKKMDTQIGQKALLYHELGHCILGLGHTDQASQNLMVPAMLDDSYYEENWTKLVRDMCLKYER